VADFRPFAALRYDTAVAGDPSTLVAPPYDVVSPEQAAELRARSEFNISRVDYGETSEADDAANNRYTRAREQLTSWLARGVLTRDKPCLYLYDQDFMVHGRRFRRRAIFGRLRLHDWDEGVVLPHEHTRAAAKADRYQLLNATRLNLSPIMAMYRNPQDRPLADLREAGPPLLSARIGAERHVLRALSREAAARVQDAIAGERLYVADGHHRYETALLYRDECRAASNSWTGEEPENFVLAAIIDIEDPGLVVLPTHRLVRMPGGTRAGDLTPRLAPMFDVRDAGDAAGEADVEALVRDMAAAGRDAPAFGAVGLRPGRLHLITVRDRAAAEANVPSDHASVWRALDVNVLHHALFPALGNLSRPEEIEFTEDAVEAARAVLAGEWDVALLLNRTPISQVLACADAGERMPQKSTFFYPKLGTGVVMYPFE
jgi:uncharacterized protein (DUF1015 family)